MSGLLDHLGNRDSCRLNNQLLTKKTSLKDEFMTKTISLLKPLLHIVVLKVYSLHPQHPMTGQEVFVSVQVCGGGRKEKCLTNAQKKNMSDVQCEAP